MRLWIIKKHKKYHNVFVEQNEIEHEWWKPIYFCDERRTHERHHQSDGNCIGKSDSRAVGWL